MKDVVPVYPVYFLVYHVSCRTYLGPFIEHVIAHNVRKLEVRVGPWVQHVVLCLCLCCGQSVSGLVKPKT